MIYGDSPHLRVIYQLVDGLVGVISNHQKGINIDLMKIILVYLKIYNLWMVVWVGGWMGGVISNH